MKECISGLSDKVVLKHWTKSGKQCGLINMNGYIEFLKFLSCKLRRPQLYNYDDIRDSWSLVKKETNHHLTSFRIFHNIHFGG